MIFLSSRLPVDISGANQATTPVSTVAVAVPRVRIRVTENAHGHDLDGRGWSLAYGVPFTRLPGEEGADERVVCSTKVPVALSSGLRFMDTPSVLDSVDG
jgi:hypothetical protein